MSNSQAERMPTLMLGSCGYYAEVRSWVMMCGCSGRHCPRWRLKVCRYVNTGIRARVCVCPPVWRIPTNLIGQLAGPPYSNAGASPL